MSIHHSRSANFAPHPYRVPISPSQHSQGNQQPQTQQHSPIEFETQFSPSNRRDIPVTNQPISFEFYDPNDAKKSKIHQHRASINRKSDVDYLFINNEGTSGGPTVSAGPSTSSSGGKVKKERTKAKSSSISGPSTITAAAPAKPRRVGGPSKKPSRESQTSGEFSVISSTIEDSTNSFDFQAGMGSRRSLASLMNAAPTPSDHPTPVSDRNSVAPSATPGPAPSPGTEPDKSPVSVDQNWSAFGEAGDGHIPADTTVEDDIMADLEMAEQQPRKRSNTAAAPGPQPPLPPPPQPRSGSSATAMAQKMDAELQMELEMDMLQGLDDPPKKLPVAPQLQPNPTPKKAESRSSIAPSPSPAPSSFTPARTPVPTATPTVGKKPAAKAAAKPKAKASAKKKADTVKGKGGGASKGDSDWGWSGTSSGRAAAAAAANALLGGGYGEDGHGGRDSVPPAHSREEENAEDDEEDDKRLYCVCRELYDNRFMLGCDQYVVIARFYFRITEFVLAAMNGFTHRAWEWKISSAISWSTFTVAHVAKVCRGSTGSISYSHLFTADPSLKTTWRIRCANGQQHPYPETADACWKAALPPLSKYCSTECGMDAMERRIAPIVCANAGLGQIPEGELLIPRVPAVKTEMSRLWRGVKDARKRDAVVVHASQTIKTNEIHPSTQPSASIKAPPQRTEAERISTSLTELAAELESLSHDAHLRSRELEFILARGRLARLAIQWSEKNENISRCSFDARLLLEGIEWEEWVEGVGRAVLEGTVDASNGIRPTGKSTLTEGRAPPSINGVGEDDELQLEIEAADGPWCDGRRKCERHFGWQKLCIAEFELNKGTKVSIRRIPVGLVDNTTVSRSLPYKDWLPSRRMLAHGLNNFDTR